MTPRSGLGMTPSLAPNDCPQAPGLQAHLRTLILHEACETAGGIDPLAALLQVPPGMLAGWLQGDGEAPEAVYQACIDIVLLHDSDRTSG